MADFHQVGTITTLHDLYSAFDKEEYLQNLEEKLERYARHVKISLLLPCLIAELDNRSVMDKIVNEIAKVRYLKNVVVALGGTQEHSKFLEAADYFGRLKSPEREVKLIWVDGPRMHDIFQKIEEKDISTGVRGKGQSVWLTMGYLFAQGESDVIALHDCDIVTYDRVLLGRLIEPTANPHSDFEFCKGYYCRISPTEKTMKGRVTRLFITPLADALMNIMFERGFQELGRFFRYHKTFKYPLAGEFSMNTKLARSLNIGYDWSLEVTSLSEVYHRVIERKIAQVDLTANYEHKHQVLSPEDANRGLHRMVVDIAAFYLHYLRAHGVPLDDAFVDMILHTYYDNALKFIKYYSQDAEMNGLSYDRYLEELLVRHFRGYLWTAWEKSRGPHESPVIPSWNRVVYSIPDIYDHLLHAVEEDNKLS